MIARVVALMLLTAPVANAQVVSPGLEHANSEMARQAQHDVQQRVEEFLKKLGSRDVAGVRALMAPKALVAIVRQKPDGTVANTYQTGDEFLAQLEKSVGQPTFEEPLSNVVVTVDSDRLAFLRADFVVLRDGKRVSSGVDQFTLLKETGGWKVAVIAYTSIPR